MAGMAQLLENQARQLVKEASATGTAEGSEEWAGVALPLVRRIFAEFAAKEFVSVQPMNLPSGLVFYLDFKYGTARPGFNQDTDPATLTGHPFASHPFASPGADDSLFGVTNADTASDGLYGAGRFGYSIKNTQVTASSQAAAAATSASVNFDSDYTNNLSNYETIEVNVPTDADLYAVRTFTLVSASVEIVPVQAFSTIDSNYTASFVVTAAQGALLDLNQAAGDLGLNYSKQPTDITRGDFEDANPFKGSGAGTGIDDGTDIDIPEVNLEMQSEPIVAKTRKLKAVWTPEFAQDLNAYHSIDAEAELTSQLQLLSIGQQ
jgi:hypothetical protein